MNNQMQYYSNTNFVFENKNKIKKDSCKPIEKLILKNYL